MVDDVIPLRRPRGRPKGKQGRRGTHEKTPMALDYERSYLMKGVTVEEYEKRKGLPPYSVYPEAQHATERSMVGFFMYRNAEPEEKNKVKHDTKFRQLGKCLKRS